MRRREFIALVGGAAVVWPLAARAQKTARLPRIGVLWHAGSTEEEGRYFTGFIEGLRELGYTDGSNILLEHRFPNEMPDRFRNMAADLIGKRLQFLKETVPGLSRVALLVNPDTEVARLYTEVTDREATKLGL